MLKMSEGSNNTLLDETQTNKQAATGEDSIKSRLCKVLPILLSCLAITISIVCIIVVNVFPIETSYDYTDDPSKLYPCVPCEKFVNCRSAEHQSLLSQLYRQNSTNNTEQCCAQNSSQLASLVKLVLTRSSCFIIELPPVVNPTNFSMSKTSMHMKLVPSTLYDENLKYPIFSHEDKYNLKFATDENNPLLEHTRGDINLFDEKVKIMDSGLYMVYSSVHFKPDSAEPCSTFENKIWSMTIRRIRPSDANFSGPILTAKHTCCDGCVRNQETAYTAGVFLLKKDDSLTVDVSGDGLVSYKPQSTFFGLTMLGPTEDV